MIRVFHGSTIEIRHPEVDRGRNNLDFGKAFYITNLKEQAERWAKVIWSRYEQNCPILNTYEFDYEIVKRRGYRVLIFPEYNQEWLEFIVDSRIGKKPWYGYDVIEGGVANDRVIDTVEGYIAGDFSADVAIGRLKYFKPNNQIAILNQHIINDHLRFVSSEILMVE